MEGLFPGFTPVRRREDTIATNRVFRDDGKPWTTARCNRLLRPLISRVSALGRLLPSGNSVPERSVSVQRTKYDNVKDEDSMREDDTNTEDDEWAPVKKKLKRTYSARLGKGTRGRPSKLEKRNQGYTDIRHRMPFLVPGEISVATPILNRTRGGSEPDAGGPNLFQENLDGKKLKRPKSRYLTKDGEAHFELSEILRDMRRTTDPSRYTLYEGIYNGLESLLKATMAHADPSMQDRTGVRSLFNTCLRKVPEVIKAEEDEFAKEMGERSAVEIKDVSSDFYMDLEGLGHGGRGWRHLRTIVRAHGIQIVGDAITQGLVKMDFARALVLLCVHTACLDEAEELLSCLLQVTICSEPRSTHSRTGDESNMIPLSVLEKFACYTGRRSFQIRQLTSMLLTEQLPMAWLATRGFGRVWTHVIQSSASDPDSSNFLTTLLPQLCSSGTKTVNFASTESVMQKALDATFASVLTALSAITLLNTPDNAGTPSKVNGGLERQSTVLRQCLIACESLPSPLNEPRASLLALSNLVTSPEHDYQSPVRKSDLFCQVARLLPVKSTQKSTDSLASFICSIACGCGRGTFNSGFNHLKLLHSRLRKYLMSQACNNKGMIREIIIDSAFNFARRHDECEHLDYAEEIESRYHGEHIADLPRRLPTEPKVDVSAGFRWEEGISEWVTATPAFSLKRAVVIPDSEEEDELDCKSSPLNQNNRRGRPRLAAPRTFTQVTKNVKVPRCQSLKGAVVIPDSEEDELDGDSPLRHNTRRGRPRLAAPRMFTQVTKHVKVSKGQEHASAAQRGKTREQNLDSSSESEDDLLSTSFDTSLISLASNNSSFPSSSQSSKEAGNGMKKHSLGRVLRPRRGHHGTARQIGGGGGHHDSDNDDDELSSATTSWDAMIRRNKISVVILQQELEQPERTVGQNGSQCHRYSTRRKSAISSTTTTEIPRKRAWTEDDGSEDELCL